MGDVFPTANWRWNLTPDQNAEIDQEEIDDLRRDRDELLAALERALERVAPDHLLSKVELEEDAQDRALIARIKGTK